MSDLRNNIFYYATKELSQDAFICWLCSHALNDIENSDIELKACAIDMIYTFINNKDVDKAKLSLISVEKQVNNIDVLLSVKYDSVIYRIIIEDKTHTSEHDDQLQRYKEKLSTPESTDIIMGVYYKMGFQSDYSNVQKAGYTIIDRATVLSILKKYVNKTSSDIFHDYYHFWNEFDTATYSFSKLRPSEWDWRQIHGFYDEIQTELSSDPYTFWVGYNYVANKSGGFYGLWYGVDTDKIVLDDIIAAVYLQLEAAWSNDKYEYKICLKLENISETDNKAFDNIKWNIVGKLSNYGFQRPKRIGYGQHVTVGIIDISSDTYEDLKRTIMNSTLLYKRLLDDRNELISGINT